jgi:hypothetical protein
MKKLLLVIAGIALLAVACRAEMNVLVDINEDRSATATFEFGLDDEFKSVIESSGGSADDLLSDMDLGADGGEPVTRTEGDMTYTGVKMDFADIDDMAAKLADDEGADALFNDFAFEMDDSTAEVKASITAPEQDAGDLPIDPSDLTDEVFSANFILSMPGNVVEHNADEVLADGSLRWDLPILGGSKDVYARSEFGGSSIPWLWIILGIVLILGVIAVIAAVVLGKRQQKTAVDDAAAAYPQSAVDTLDTPAADDDDGATVESDNGDGESADDADQEDPADETESENDSPDGSDDPEDATDGEN